MPIKSTNNKLKIHVVSDLHVEFADFSYSERPDADVVIAAGDIGAGMRGVDWIKRNWPDRPVIYVAGNHEFYKERLPTHRKALKAATANTDIRFLDRETVIIDGVRFIGSTLWTDFALDGAQDAAMREAEETISDYFEIGIAPGIRLSAEYVLREHLLDRQFIETELAKPFKGQTVVVTHHAPSPRSIHERFQGDPINPIFASDLDELIVSAKPDLWIHGHVHQSFDYQVDKTRILANPRGYPDEHASQENVEFTESLRVLA